MNWDKRILHLGLGRFHRGHQAVYYQRLSRLGESWGVVSLSMRSPGARDELRGVNCRYPVLELGRDKEEVVLVEPIREALDATQDIEKVLEYFCDPKIELITLTITEKGYCLKSDGTLDRENSGIKHDLTRPSHPQTAIGLLSLGLSLRREKISQGLTILSCDNLRENGVKLKKALYEFSSPELRDWLEKNVSFPNTMVDRIVPALDPVKESQFEKNYHLSAKSHLIATETFSQWVIEDHFKGARPHLEKVGVEFVKDVRPYEEMKLRLLNASHSYLAYAGILKGHTFVHEAVSDPELKKDIEELMLKEVAPLLQLPPGFDVVRYSQSLLERFTNHKLPHQLRQIAMDGSQKIPQRILPSLFEARKRGTPHEVLTKAIHAWLDFLWSERNQKIDDPMSAEFLKLDKSSKEKWLKGMFNLELFKGLHF